ncbi:hypothetical protein FQN49_005211, partial [Arthroderma sp. PD_2]
MTKGEYNETLPGDETIDVRLRYRCGWPFPLPPLPLDTAEPNERCTYELQPGTILYIHDVLSTEGIPDYTPVVVHRFPKYSNPEHSGLTVYIEAPIESSSSWPNAVARIRPFIRFGCRVEIIDPRYGNPKLYTIPKTDWLVPPWEDEYRGDILKILRGKEWISLNVFNYEIEAQGKDRVRTIVLVVHDASRTEWWSEVRPAIEHASDGWFQVDIRQTNIPPPLKPSSELAMSNMTIGQYSKALPMGASFGVRGYDTGTLGGPIDVRIRGSIRTFGLSCSGPLARFYADSTRPQHPPPIPIQPSTHLNPAIQSPSDFDSMIFEFKHKLGEEGQETAQTLEHTRGFDREVGEIYSVQAPRRLKGDSWLLEWSLVSFREGYSIRNTLPIRSNVPKNCYQLAGVEVNTWTDVGTESLTNCMKVGRTTGWTAGKINGIEAAINVNNVPFLVHAIIQEDDSTASCFGFDGDLGAWVLSTEFHPRLLGILVGGGERWSGMCPIRQVFSDIEKELGCEIVRPAFTPILHSHTKTQNDRELSTSGIFDRHHQPRILTVNHRVKMSHRKYEAPRHGSLAYLPRKRAARHRGKVKSFPKDDPKKPVHLTATMGYKAGMTTIVRDLERPGAKMHRKEVVEAVTVVETPPMIAVGIVGYIETPRGLRSLTTVWADHLSDEVKRRFYKNWYKSKKKAFTRYAKTHADAAASTRELERIKNYCTVV